MKVFVTRPTFDNRDHPDDDREWDDRDRSGLYELTCTSWDEPYLVITPHPITGELTEETGFQRHRWGDIVLLTHAQARRLLKAGAVVVPGERERAQLAQAQVAVRFNQQLDEQAVARLNELSELVAANTGQADELWKAGRLGVVSEAAEVGETPPPPAKARGGR